MFKLIIVRHGQTIENQKNICQGQSEGVLSEMGKKENKILAKRLSHYKIDALFASPLKRAIETGIEIIKYHENLVLQIDHRLMERDMGILQGRTFPEAYTMSASYEGMESLDDVKLRLSHLLSDLEKRHRDQTILLLSHGVTIVILIALLRNSPLTDIDQIGLIDNSSLIEHAYGEK